MARGVAPQTELENIEPTKSRLIMESLLDLNDLGKPKTCEELKDRISRYFAYCEKSSLRPGVESLAYAVGVSRITIYQWSLGNGCDKDWQAVILNAKALIAAYLEQAALSGQINPATAIFLMKGWLGYSDTVSLEQKAEEEYEKNKDKRVIKTADLLPKLRAMMDEDNIPNVKESGFSE